MDQQECLERKQELFDHLVGLLLQAPECRAELLRVWQRKVRRERSTAKLSDSYGSTSVPHRAVEDQVRRAFKALERGAPSAPKLLKQANLSSKLYQSLVNINISNERIRKEVADTWQSYLEIRNKLITDNYRLVLKLASKYRSPSPEDLAQEGCIGLIRAIEKYDTSRRIKFSSYAGWWILQAIRRYLKNGNRSIRLPHHIQDQLSKMHRAKRTLLAEDGQVTVSELAYAANLERDTTERLLQISHDIVSLEAPIRDRAREAIKDTIPDREMRMSQHHWALSSVCQLPHPEQEVLIARFGLSGGVPLALSEIAQKLGIQESEAQEAERRGLRRLRDMMGGEG